MPLALATYAMGARFEFVLDRGCGEERYLRAAGEAALEEIQQCERRLSPFRRDSLIAHVHRAAPFAPVPLDEDTFALLEMALEVHRASGGAFDVTVAPVMEALGFHPSEERLDRERASARVGSQAIELDRGRRTVRLARPGVRLDLGAIGKGHALDLAARVLRECGVERALLHGGTSSVVALGAPPDLDGWRVALEPGSDPACAVLRDAGLGVSGQHRITDERGRGHVLDPRRGESVATSAIAAAAAPLGPGGAALADAWSTALLVLGDLPAEAPVEGLVGEAQTPDRGGRRGRRWRRCGAAGSIFRVPQCAPALATIA